MQIVRGSLWTEQWRDIFLPASLFAFNVCQLPNEDRNMQEAVVIRTFRILREESEVI